MSFFRGGVVGLGLMILISVLGRANVKDQLISESVGSIRQEILTLREAVMSSFAEKPIANTLLSVPQTKEEKIQAVNTLLLDRMVEAEALNLGFKDIDAKEVFRIVLSLEKELSGASIKAYRFQVDELKTMVERKLIVRNFLKSKTESFVSLLSEQDLQSYYDKNRLRFGSMPLIQMKENIRAYLSQKQKEERLVSWIEVLKRKYKAKNYLIEGQKDADAAAAAGT